MRKRGQQGQNTEFKTYNIMISLNIEKTLGFISKENVFAYEAQVKAAQEALENGTGKGNDFLGWLHLPSSPRSTWQT